MEFVIRSGPGGSTPVCPRARPDGAEAAMHMIDVNKLFNYDKSVPSYEKRTML